MIKLKLRQTLRLLVLVAVMPLAACTILPESPIQQVYLLPAQPVAVAGARRLNARYVSCSPIPASS